ncbi:ANTAR domain-containing protein [Mycobacterium sp. 852002-51057_SCH5723018]|uniref:ANTAR domain-containing protein n=1 Tax=Mycobacterium sp. 852002-51057_SCH5723018 TaxID=1834094 RepID=UPI0009EE66BF
MALIANDKQLQFQSALASRDTIAQAKGMIMERFGVDAFELLTVGKLQHQTRQRRRVIVARGSDCGMLH